MGLIGGVLQPLYGGFPVTLMSPVDFLQQPIRWLQAISRYQATTSGGPNFAYDLCLRKITPAQLETLDLSSWEVAFTGAEPVRAETLEEFAATFAPCGFRKEAFYSCYGMAETTLIVSGGLKTNPPVIRRIDRAALEQNRVVASTNNLESRTIVGCGRTWLNQHLLIVNPETCIRTSGEEIGEIWVSGASIAQGYWNRPQETKQIFDAYLADTREGPFLRTGDLGFVQDGELFITGRLKEIIIIRGQNHYPHDIELTVEKSNPALRPNSGAAFAVDFNGTERLVVVHEVERSFLRKLDVKQVIDNIREAVAAQHGIEIYATVLVKTSSIPKTSSGKIRRRACRAAFLTGSLDVVEDWSENPQGKSNFIKLQSEAESILQKLQTNR
jgi:acyl-CoA synthetase (AMP-forming)/AMP-acid ligase II